MAYNKEAYERRKELQREYYKKYNAEHREEVRARNNEYNRTHKDVIAKANKRKWEKMSVEERRAKWREAFKKHYDRKKALSQGGLEK